ncbi:hypothetical protein C943_00104 [Mariniradius saccharolyticus AK6]|uniref:Uncharacterized protein n=1 Tax=Mariniradius saccharolyticus AK6 TaxID=1239962 RepID=M7YDW4_9BACT|nr:hypothetical protein C943_00104 [Mariniradius saccharolyticus AK6]
MKDYLQTPKIIARMSVGYQGVKSIDGAAIMAQHICASVDVDFLDISQEE